MMEQTGPSAESSADPALRAGEVEARIDENEDQRQKKKQYDQTGTRRVRRLFHVPSGIEIVGDGKIDPLADPRTEKVPRDKPDRDDDDDPDENEKPHVSAQKLGCRYRTRMRGHENMHHRKGCGNRDTIKQQASLEAPPDREDHREHHDQPRVEKDRKAEDQRCDAKRHGCAFFAESPDEIIGKRLRAARYFKQTAQHRAKADQKRHPTKGRSEGRCDGGQDVARWDAGRECR